MAIELETKEVETPSKLEAEDEVAPDIEDDAGVEVEAGVEAEAISEEEAPKKVYDAAYWKAEYFREKKKRQQAQKEGRSFYPEGVAGVVQETEKSKPIEEVKTVKDLVEHVITETRRASRAEMGELDKTNRIRTTQTAARSKHDGADGNPSYDDVLDEIVLPMIRENPNLFALLREMPDPAEAAYTLGMIVKYPELERRGVEKGRKEVVDGLQNRNLRPKILKQQQKEPALKQAQTAEDIMRMSPEEIEAEIARVTGRTS